jgi:hypothetical protein
MVEDQGTDFLSTREIIAKSRRNSELFDNKSSYEPPYDSPIEAIFAWNLGKYINPDLKLDKQIEVNTPWGIFILDFVVECESERIAFECDGKDFHDVERDEWRDAVILGEGHVDTIYRLRGTDLVHRAEDCLFIISHLEPQIFSNKGRANLETLANDYVKESLARKLSFDNNLAKGTRLMVFECSPRSEYFSPPFICILRESRHIPDGEISIWESKYTYALKNKGMSLDGLIEEYNKEPYPEDSEE